MLLPLMAFVLGCVVYAILGLIVLVCVPSFRLTFPSLIFFVVGALLTTPVCLFAYGQIFARNDLSDAAFVGIFPVLLVGAVFGGALVVCLKERFSKKQLVKPPV
jgi:hypothetical protein